MRPLIDGDILRYEIGFSGEYKNEEGELVIRDFEFVDELLEKKIKEICSEAEADETPVLFLTQDKIITRELNKWLKRRDKPLSTLLPNFREAIAVSRGYKANRKSQKPFHFDNITIHMMNKYHCVFANGVEADDLMGATQCVDPNATIICSRDKDLRMIPGWHYSWECGRQHAIGPEYTDRIGWLVDDGKKFYGYGLKFFFAQMLMGDTVDNIPGLPYYGKKKVLKLLDHLTTEEEMLDCVTEEYKKVYPDTWKDVIREQADLLWIGQKINALGMVVPYSPKKGG